jgi:ethanolamine utilization protein EutP (predicted NTPase)
MLEFSGSEDPRAKVELSGRSSETSNYIPSRKLILPVTNNQSNTGDSAIHLTIKGNYLRMDQLVMLDILASNQWRRPVYFASVQEPMALGLDKYLQLDGYAYKLTPKKTDPQDYSDIGFVDTESLYTKLMNRFSYASLANSKAYLDWTHVTVVMTVGLRNKFVRLAESLLMEGKKEKAIAVLDKITSLLPNERIAFDYNVIGIADLYLRAGETTKGNALLKKLKDVTNENISYFQSLPKNLVGGVEYDYRVNMYMMQEIERLEGR